MNEASRQCCLCSLISARLLRAPSGLMVRVSDCYSEGLMLNPTLHSTQGGYHRTVSHVACTCWERPASLCHPVRQSNKGHLYIMVQKFGCNLLHCLAGVMIALHGTLNWSHCCEYITVPTYMQLYIHAHSSELYFHMCTWDLFGSMKVDMTLHTQIVHVKW